MTIRNILLIALVFVFILFNFWCWGIDLTERGPNLGFALFIASILAFGAGVFLYRFKQEPNNGDT